MQNLAVIPEKQVLFNYYYKDINQIADWLGKCREWYVIKKKNTLKSLRKVVKFRRPKIPTKNSDYVGKFCQLKL